MALALVTLTTDFGTADGYVGAMKGVLHRLAPGVIVVDVSHEVPRHDVAAGAHALATAARWFPPGTVHVGVVDPGVGTARRGVAIASGGHVFVGPDNGLFDLAAPAPDAVHEITAVDFRAERVAATFHGRDVFAVAAARLAAGAPVAAAGLPVALSGRLAGRDGHRVVHVDVYGNLITNVAVVDEALPAGRVLVAGRDVGPLRRTFGDVAAGELVAYLGSGGTVEIAVREGSAAEALGVGRGTAVELDGGAPARDPSSRSRP